MLAFYDPDAKEVVIRGGTKFLDVPHRVVLAHELTHVLQDQHFDLNQLQDAVRRAPGQSPEALRAVIEGDANRIEDKYLSGLSQNDRTDFRTWERKGVQSADRATADVPAVLDVLQSAPYAFGPLALAGRRRRRRQRRGGPRVRARRVHPGALRGADRVAHGAGAGADRRAEGGPGREDRRDARPAGCVRPLPAARVAVDGADALAAASTWSGGRSRTVRADGRTCVRGVVDASTSTGARGVEARLRSGGRRHCRRGWRRCGAPAAGSSLRSCDPGADSTLASPDAAITRAQNLLVAHNELEVALVREVNGDGLPLRVVRCAALEFVRSPQLSALLAQARAGRLRHGGPQRDQRRGAGGARGLRPLSRGRAGPRTESDRQTR